MSQKYEKLKTLLKELFQLDQPDLDFGLYRVMHAKSGEITQFLDKDLLPQVKQAFGAYQSADRQGIEQELAKLIATLEAAGSPIESSTKVAELRAKLANESVDIGKLESEVYDHLYSFFRRYYSEGDFLAKRVYKPGVYAIPYEGEEVTLHWANKDQYYIKTSEYLRDYAFRLQPDNEQNSMRVHFRLVDAAEGEHGNVKAAEGKERLFILAPGGGSGHDFISEEQGPEGKELVIRFEYRPATLNDWPTAVADDKKNPPKQKDLLGIAAERLLAVQEKSLLPWLQLLKQKHTLASVETADYSRLEAHLRRYSARNTFDYFIHKDLGGFLRRELDFYIKNEVMHLDDVENESVARVEQYLSKIKVLRRIAGKIIVFLEQLENFQRRMWLKKKLVTKVRLCLSLDRIPESLFPKVIANHTQRDEWIKLFAINELAASDTRAGYSEPLTVEFLKQNLNLVIDTEHFSDEFTADILNSIPNFDNDHEGVAIHGDNFQAIRLVENAYENRIDGIYLDPPYNTDASPIIYKNGYRHSSWACMFADRIEVAANLLTESGLLCVAIDDFEYPHLYSIIENAGTLNHIATTVVRSKPQGRPTATGFSTNHEYAAYWSGTSTPVLGRIPRKGSKAERYPLQDHLGVYAWANFRKSGTDSDRKDRPKSYYPLFINDTDIRIPSMTWDPESETWIDIEYAQPGETIIWPVDSDGNEKVWTCSASRLTNELDDVRVSITKSEIEIQKKYRPNQEGALPGTWWDHPEYSASESGTKVLKDLFGYKPFDFPKSINLVADNLRVLSSSKDAIFLDYFGGSGTTASAVLELNREDGGNRKYVIVEQGDYFESVLVPRLKKSIYSPEWKLGKPTNRNTGISQLFKIVHLESYEDSLNNLETQRTQQQQTLLDAPEAKGPDSLKEQYLLRYMLDVETRGSQSLLNVQAFTDPTAYKLKVKRPGSDESREVNVDLQETFNWLLGLTVEHIAAPVSFKASFGRDAEQRLILKGSLKKEADGPWWFRTVTGTLPDGRKALVIWRKLPGDMEQDNLVLDEWFRKNTYSTQDAEFDVIYVNGGNNLPNMRRDGEHWKVRLIEEDFHRLMFDTETV